MEQPAEISGDGPVAARDGPDRVTSARMSGTVLGTPGLRGRTRRTLHLEVGVVILGAILLIIGLVASLSILVWIGIILLVVGLVLNFVPIGGTRRRYY
jgi:hypothetical protein